MHRMLQTASNPDDIRWLPGARLNVAESALCVRDPDVPAVIWATEEAPDVLHTLSLGGLHREAMRFAAALRAAGFSPGAHGMPLYDGRGRRRMSRAIMANMLPSDVRARRKPEVSQECFCEEQHGSTTGRTRFYASWRIKDDVSAVL